jgi:DNA-3-methyladenine glycosylase
VKLDKEFFGRSVHEVAPDLIGCTLLVDGVGGPPGHAYVYRSYGIHWCLNLVCEEQDVAAAVLLRALEPTQGVEAMRTRRGLDEPRLLAAGPGRLCQALGVTRDHDGLPLDRPPFELRARGAEPEIVNGPRVGISRAADLPWRYGLAGSPYLSRSFRLSARRPA